MTEVIVSELAIYPVKSMRQILVPKSEVEAFGLKYDRRWMVVDEQGQFITQRQQARLCLINQNLSSTGVTLQTEKMPTLSLSGSNQQQKMNVTIWNDQCSAIDCGDEAAKWISQFLDTPSRIVFFPDTEVRQVDPDYANLGDKTAFSDGFPLLLISQASLDDLNSRLQQPVTMTQFRPNIVISGCEAFAEDKWKKIKIGDIEYRIVKPCSRCIIPSINIETAKPAAEPLKTLASYRKQGNKVYFGQNIIAENEGSIEIGMPVTIIS